MTVPKPSNSDSVFMKRTVEAAIRIGVIVGLIAWCYLIARPFLAPIIWGAVIAVAVFHGYDRLQTGLSGRPITAAVLIAGAAEVRFVPLADIRRRPDEYSDCGRFAATSNQ